MKAKTTKLPVKTSDRKRPCKNFIERTAKARGYMTGNEKTSLTTLNVKNVMQKVNNRAMSDNGENQFTHVQNEKLSKLMREFVNNINAVIDGK